MGFGGVLPLARRSIVEKRGWLSAAEFTELLAICQILPGGNICNMSVAIGLRFHGVLGAVVSVVGLILVPGVVLIALGSLYEQTRTIPAVAHGVAGLAAAAAGLLWAMAAKLAWPLRRQAVALGVALACVLAISVAQVPLLWLMVAAVPVSVVVMAWVPSKVPSKISRDKPP